MSATEAYMAALEAGDDRALAKAEERVGAEAGPAGLIECLSALLERGDDEQARMRLAAACEELAESRDGPASRAAALRALALYDGISDEDGLRRATTLAVLLSVTDDDALQEAAAAAGGAETALQRVSKRAKDKDIKQDAAAMGGLRRAASRLAELSGDVERAFTEMLRAVRKVPREPLYIDEVFRLALASEKHEELALVFDDIASGGELPKRQRATLHNKVGHLRERGLGDPAGALLAYRASVALNSKSKGAKRHVKRLEKLLAEQAEVPPTDAGEPPPSMTDAAPPDEKAAEPTAAPDQSAPPTEVEAPAQPDPEPEPEPESESESESYTEIGDDDVVEATEKGPRPIVTPGLSLPPPPPVSDEGEFLPDGDDSVPEEGEPSMAAETDFADDVPTAAGARSIPTAIDTLGTQDHTAGEMTTPSADDDSGRHTPIDADDEVDSTAKSGAHKSAISTVLEVPAAPTELAAPPSAVARAADAAVEEDSSAAAPSPVSLDDAEPLQDAEVEVDTSSADASVDEEPAAEARPVDEQTPASEEPAEEEELAADETAAAEEPAAATSNTGIGVPPSDAAPRTVLEEGARDIFAEAGTLLGGDDIEDCIACAVDMQERPDKGSMPLRLAAHALTLASARGEEMPERALDVFIEEAPGQGRLVVALADALWAAIPEETRVGALPVWVAAARGAGDDVAEARRLLMPFAPADAPHGMAFRQLDQTLKAAGDTGAREELWKKAYLQNDVPERRRAILLGHIRLLTDAKRQRETLLLYETLVVDVAPGDEVLRDRALKTWERWGAAEDRAHFLGRLSRAIEGPQSIAVLKRLLQDRMRAEDSVGAEAAARELLERDAQNIDALEALCELLEPHAHRSEELIDLSRARYEMAKKRGDGERTERAARELAALLKSHERTDEAADVLDDAIALLPDSEHLFLEVSELLEQSGRGTRLLEIVELVAERTDDARRKVAMLLRGAEMANTKLDRPGRAQELVARALEARPDDVNALLLRADLALELDDAKGALSSLERLAAKLQEPADRARVHTRIGHLLEEHLLRPDDALKRYKAAVEANPKRADAWEAMKGLYEQRADRDGVVTALTGLAHATQGKAAAAHFKALAHIERDERVDVEKAEEAFGLALRQDPTDAEALDDLLHLVVARISGEHDLETALMMPDDAVLEAVEEPLNLAVDAARDAGIELSFNLRRMRALAAGRSGERRAATDAFEALLTEQATDLVTLRGYSRFLKGDDAEASRERRLHVLETILLHHAPELPLEGQVRLWGEVGALRWDSDEPQSARKALKTALEIALREDLPGELTDHAASRAWRALEAERDPARVPRLVAFAGMVLGSRKEGREASDILVEAARIARDEAGDTELSRSVLQLAVERDPESRGPRKSLLDLEVQDGNADAAIENVRALLKGEKDKTRKAEAQLQLAELLMSAGRDDEASQALRAALDLDASSRATLDAAEAFFAEKKDASGLEALYSAQLKTIDKGDVKGRVTLLERLAQVRRYDLRDQMGAVEALEAISALDPEAVKPREDAARLYTELGQWREAAQAWRGVLERDPLAREAWRGLFTLYARTGQGDETYSVGAAMAAVDLADGDITACVRQLRPPFPRWPRPPKDPQKLKRRVGHALEATPLRLVLDRVGLSVHRAFARPLSEFGLSGKDRIPERQVPPSVLLAIRTVTDLIGLGEIPRLYRANTEGEGGDTVPFSLLPAPVPGLVISDAALRGGMTPDRAFALGRAMAWLTPHAILAGTLSSVELKEVLESLVVRFIPNAEVDGKLTQLEHLGHRLESEMFKGLPGTKAEEVRRGVLHALRDWVHARDQVQVADWMAGVGYTADRIGFLLTGDLVPAVRVIKASGGRDQQAGARLAIKELVLFSVSQQYLALRRELGLALPDSSARPILELE